MPKILTIRDLNPGDSFRFKEDMPSNRWEVIESPPSWRKINTKEETTLCLMSSQNMFASGLFPQCRAFPNELIIFDVIRKRKRAPKGNKNKKSRANC